MGGSTSVQVPKANYSKDIRKLLSAYQATMPDVLSFEQQFRPQFQGLNLGDISAFLQGSGGQQGIFGLGQQATQQSQEQLAAARQAELQSMQQQAGMARGVSQALSPEQAGVVGASTSEAMRARQSSYGLNPQEQREATQAAREAFGARGMLGSNASVAGEVLNREQSLFRKRQEAAQAEQQAFNMAGQFYTQPGFSMLGSQPLSYQTGQQQLGLGLGAIGAGTPQLFSPDAALNLGAAQRQSMLNAQMAQAQAGASRSSGLMGGIGSAIGGIGGSFFGPIGTAIGSRVGGMIGGSVG
jgi:peptidoglycan hydrolase-like protein with peptidoglycan-binding domain